MEKSYLGDGLYVSFNNGMICLTSENGIEVLNTVYLEPEVYQALTVYVDNLKKETEKD